MCWPCFQIFLAAFILIILILIGIVAWFLLKKK
jgi:hypothetical protein